MATAFDARAIERALDCNLGRPLRFFESVGSTSTEAAAWADEGAPHGALVVADHQTTGRGRLGRSWVSRPGRALQFSLILRPERALENRGLLPIALGVAVAEGIEDVVPLSARLKWPNDVTSSGRKLAGILVETRSTGVPEAFVAGVGVNVDWPCDELERDLGSGATSISCELARRGGPASTGRAVLLGAILRRTGSAYELATQPERAAELIARASERSDVLGRALVVRLAGGQALAGIARQLLPSGELELEVDGERHVLQAGVIERATPV